VKQRARTDREISHNQSTGNNDASKSQLAIYSMFNESMNHFSAKNSGKAKHADSVLESEKSGSKFEHRLFTRNQE